MKAMLLSFLVLAIQGGSLLASVLNSGDFTYKISGDGIGIIGYFGQGGSVQIPATIAGLPVTGIETGAFSGRMGVTGVLIPNTVTVIGADAFFGCHNMASVAIPDSVVSIGFRAFGNCPRLSELVLPAGIDKIEGSLCSGCENLCSITIPDRVTTIGNYAFMGCSSLNKITIPNNVTRIGDGAFRECTGLTEVFLGSGLDGIGNYVFSSCSYLKAFTVDPSNRTFTTASGVLFNKNGTKLLLFPPGKKGNYVVPDTAASIKPGAFYGCAALAGVVISGSVTVVGNDAFRDCIGLENVQIGRGVTFIGNTAFYDCTSLKSLVLPDSVTSIGGAAFIGCTGLTNVVLPGGLTNIANSLFHSCKGLANITIPDSVTRIDGLAFYNCSRLKNVTIPQGITNIGEYAFSGCSSLTCISIPASVTYIGWEAFTDCAKLESVLFEGNAPAELGDVFQNAANDLTVYYYPDAVGWGSTFAGRPTSMKPFRILNPLDSGVVMEGTTIRLPARIKGVPPLAYQWYFDGRPLDGATNVTLTISAANALNAGSYMVVASNASGAVTNGPATLGVCNIAATNYFGLMLSGPVGEQLKIQSAENALGPWKDWTNLLVTSTPQACIDFEPMNGGQRFYRATQSGGLKPCLLPVLSLQESSGNQQKIEYVDAQTGFTNWQFLTNITLSSNPSLFIDITATNRLPRYYRTTTVP